MATIGSPTKRTTSAASSGRARVGGIGTMPAGVTLTARSAAVTTASTPGMAERLAHVELDDAPVGERRPDELHVGQPRRLEVGDVGGLPGQEPRVLDPLDALPRMLMPSAPNPPATVAGTGQVTAAARG